MFSRYRISIAVIHFVFVVLSTQLAMIYGGCSIPPDSNGHVNIPSDWTSIPFEAFFECNGLISVTIGNSVTALDNAFAY